VVFGVRDVTVEFFSMKSIGSQNRLTALKRLKK
jgi:hypothetical protein